jgi:hypothetical protein
MDPPELEVAGITSSACPVAAGRCASRRLDGSEARGQGTSSGHLDRSRGLQRAWATLPPECRSDPKLRTRGHRGLPCWLRPRQRSWPFGPRPGSSFRAVARTRSHDAVWPWRSVSSGWRAHLRGHRPPNTPTLTSAQCPREEVGPVGSACRAERGGSAATRWPTYVQRSLFRRAGLRGRASRPVRTCLWPKYRIGHFAFTCRE